MQRRFHIGTECLRKLSLQYVYCIIEGNLRFVPIFFDAKKCLYCVSLIGKTWILVCLPFIHVKCLFNWRKNEILYSMSPLYACSVSLIGENMRYSTYVSPLFMYCSVSLIGENMKYSMSPLY